MDWRALGQRLTQLGLPLLGAALPIPGGAAIGTALASAIGSEATPEGVLGALTQSADAIQKAREFELTHQETILRLTLEYQAKEVEAQSANIQAEAKGESWLQRNWRPLLMLWFGVLLGLYWFGISPPNLTQATLDNLFHLMQLAIGGYVGGRTLEKVAPTIAEAITARKTA